jgi:hypothetical protein
MRMFIIVSRQVFILINHYFMRSISVSNSNKPLIIIFVALILSGGAMKAQDIRFGIFADPVISWFSSDTKLTKSQGARAGFNFGFTFNRYFAKNYSFSTGVSILNAGGRIYNTQNIVMEFNNYDTTVISGKSVVYHIQYINIPLGLKFESNQIGYLKFFSDIGLDPKIVIGGKVDIPSNSIKGETALKELRRLNLSYHIMAGVEYSLGGTTELNFGLGYENNFLDVTKELNSQPVDRITQNILKFRIGVNF